MSLCEAHVLESVYFLFYFGSVQSVCVRFCFSVLRLVIVVHVSCVSKVFTLCPVSLLYLVSASPSARRHVLPHPWLCVRFESVVSSISQFSFVFFLPAMKLSFELSLPVESAFWVLHPCLLHAVHDTDSFRVGEGS